jgi:hypothetical protein
MVSILVQVHAAIARDAGSKSIVLPNNVFLREALESPFTRIRSPHG